ncbi:MAG: hypothetical protein GX572_06035 [Clostridia bacterium]|nr:hypothetical protein [Clostridia bacterium]
MEEYFLNICHEENDELECEMILLSELPYQRQIIRRLSVLGVIDVQGDRLPANQVGRVAKILRLRNAFGLNLSGAAIICDLLSRLEELEKQVEFYQRL